MDTMMLVWILLAALVGLVMMLIVVSIARGFDKSQPALKTSLPASLNSLFTTSGEAKPEAGDAEKTKKQTTAVVSVATSLAVVAGVVGLVSNFAGGDVEPVVSELAAGELRGTMMNTRDSDPVVLIVPGSGPTDRDGNSPAGLRTDAYKLLAEGLAEERISSVRVDKRGMFGSASAGDGNDVTPADYVADIHAWIDAIKTARGPDSGCIFLLGHSEGALMVSLAAEGREDVCGLILVAGMGRPMGDVIRQQLMDNPANAPLIDQAFTAIAELEAGRRVDTSGMHPALLSLFAPQVQAYLMSVINIDPVEAVRRAKKDTLVVQGKTDLQIGVEDAHLLNKAPKTKLQLINGMNHVLKEAPADPAANLATYADPSLPLAPKLVGRIEDFVDDND